MRPIPPGWDEVALGDLGEWRGGGTPPKATESYWRNGTIPWVSPKDMKRSVIEDAEDKLSAMALGHPAAKLVPAGSVLVVVRSGILQHSLPVAVTAREVAINQDIRALIPHDGISAAFVAAQLRAEARTILRETVKSGMTVQSIAFDRFRDFRIRLAPSHEQTRIVAKLEPLLVRCGQVRSELARVEKLVARQLRAAMTAAFSGHLTHEPRSPDGEPIGWRTLPLSSILSDGPSNGMSPRASVDGTGTLSLKLTATTSGSLRLDEGAIKRVQAKPPKNSKYWLRSGDLLVQRANALVHLGAAAIFEGEDHKYIYPDLMMRVRIADPLIRTYIWRFLNSPTARQYFQDHATGTAGNMPKITGATLAALPVPIPPQDRIRAVLTAIDRVIARINDVKSANDRCARLVEKLEQAFLLRASRGELVKQSSGDEPASRILERARSRPHDQIARRTSGEAKHPEIRMESPRTFLERQLAVWPSAGLSFDDFRSDAPGSYEELKELIFEMLGTGILSQRFDSRERQMKLVKAS